MTATIGNSENGGGGAVYLAIYDLSNGMARTLSRQFLGVAIDMIPHTSILVYGKEYYFGGGIQSSDPTTFRSSTGLMVVQTIFLGNTSICQSDFDRWCLTVGTTHYHPQSYDLLTRNCNHFSNEAAKTGLRLSMGVPDWILQVPNQFVSSPMGQMIRPMLEQMQITTNQHSSDVDHHHHHHHHPAEIVPAISTSSSTSSSSSRTISNQLQNNPWAATTKTTTTNPMTTTTSTVGSIPNKTTPIQGNITITSVNNNNNIVVPTTQGSSVGRKHGTPSISTSVLTKYTSPMLSQDHSTLDLCIKKVTPTLLLHLSSTSNSSASASVTSKSTTPQTLEGTGYDLLFHRLKRLKSTDTNSASVCDNNTGNSKGNDIDAADDGGTLVLVESSVRELWNLLLTEDNTTATTNHNNKNRDVTLYLLLILRLVVLDSCERIGTIPYSVMEWMARKMESDSEDGSGWKTSSARSLAWCVLSNAIATTTITDATTTNATTKNGTSELEVGSSIQQRLVDAAICDLIIRKNQSKVEVRQAASTYLYNFVLWQQKQQPPSRHPNDDENHDGDHDIVVLDDTSVSILCSNIDGSIMEEIDPTTRLRRLLVVGRILIPTKKKTKKRKTGSGIITDTETTTTNPPPPFSIVNTMAQSLACDVGFDDNTLLLLLTSSQDGDNNINNKDATEVKALAVEILSYLNGMI
jgi:hypothetical protein